jgi:predicted GIY-YIG superfamily endonuclease
LRKQRGVLETGSAFVADATVFHARGKRALTAEQRHQRLSLDIKVVLDGTVPFRRTSDVLIPARPGVYIIHDLRGALYVGRTCSLLRRFQEHELQPNNPLIGKARRNAVGPLMFSWINLEDAKRRQAVEAELVQALDPPCNRCTPNQPVTNNEGE